MALIPSNIVQVHNRSSQHWQFDKDNHEKQMFCLSKSNVNLSIESWPYLLVASNEHERFQIQISKKDWQRSKHNASYLTVASSSTCLVHAYLRRKADRAILVILDSQDMANWMSAIPNEKSITDIHIPGTHESCAYFGFPFAQCQNDISLYDQLSGGIRAIDLRFSVKNGQLAAYHGPISQRSSAVILFAELHRFLAEHPTETVITSIKQEDKDARFPALLATLILSEPDKWYIENSFPTMGQCRGKAVLLSRFESIPQIGLHPAIWPYNLKGVFEYKIHGIPVQTQDWCEVNTIRIAEKMQLVTNLLLSPNTTSTFKLNFTSGATFVTGMPWVLAKGLGLSWLGIRGINTRFMDLMLELRVNQVKTTACCFMIDFVEFPSGLIPLIVSLND